MQNTRGFRCLSLTVVLALLLAAPWPAAAQPSEAPHAETKAGPIHLVLAWLEALWVDAGCIFDPNGLCRDGAIYESPSENEGLDNGCSFDPNGGGCRDGG